MNSNRREFLAIAGVGALAGYAGYSGGRETKQAEAKLPLAGKTSSVAIVKAASYSHDLADAMRRGILECGLNVADKSVLLKPGISER